MASMVHRLPRGRHPDTAAPTPGARPGATYNGGGRKADPAPSRPPPADRPLCRWAQGMGRGMAQGRRMSRADLANPPALRPPPSHVAPMLAIGAGVGGRPRGTPKNRANNASHRQREPARPHLPGDLPARHTRPIQPCRVQQVLAPAL